MNWSQFLSILGSIFSGWVLLLVQREQKRRQKRRKEEQQEMLLQLRMIQAGNELSHACAMALKRGKANGEVEAAEESYRQCRQEYEAFLQGLAAERLH